MINVWGVTFVFIFFLNCSTDSRFFNNVNKSAGSSALSMGRWSNRHTLRALTGSTRDSVRRAWKRTASECRSRIDRSCICRAIGNAPRHRTHCRTRGRREDRPNHPEFWFPLLNSRHFKRYTYRTWSLILATGAHHTWANAARSPPIVIALFIWDDRYFNLF